jgi:hypothetical protein
MAETIMAQSYDTLDFGTVPTTVGSTDILVELNPDFMFGDFAEAYVQECFRRNPIRANEVKITSEELKEYIQGILAIHIENDHHECKNWRNAKQLYIPTWIQFIISKVGTVWDYNSGRKFVPQFNHEYDMENLIKTSNKLRMFIADGISMRKDAFPRDTEGDLDFMSYAIINDYVVGINKDQHPIASYVAAFLGFQLQKEAAFSILYSVRYDDINFIRSQLFADDTIIK